jgi:mono/diheme cytochrome c family protein
MRAHIAARIVAATLGVTAALILLGGAIFVYSGFYNVAATNPHWSLTHWVMETGRTRSIKVHAVGIAAPPGLADPRRVLLGTEHFAAHCALCHGAPGVPRGDIGQGLYPKPPDLAKTAPIYTPGELFWIVKHGIKSTGMPAWSDHSDDEIWATVAFLEKLPGLGEQDYARLVMQNVMQGGRHNHGGNATGPDAKPPAEDHDHH